MSVIDCPCGQDCFVDFDEDGRSVAEGTLHWQAALLSIAGREFGGAVERELKGILRAIESRMVTARNRFIERVMGYEKGSLN